MRKKWTHLDKDAVIASYERTRSVELTAREFESHESTIYLLLKRNGIRTDKKGKLEREIEWFQSLLDDLRAGRLDQCIEGVSGAIRMLENRKM